MGTKYFEECFGAVHFVHVTNHQMFTHKQISVSSSSSPFFLVFLVLLPFGSRDMPTRTLPDGTGCEDTGLSVSLMSKSLISSDSECTGS